MHPLNPIRFFNVSCLQVRSMISCIFLLLCIQGNTLAQVACDNAALQLVGVTPGVPCSFTWQDSCSACGNYEIQILRLYNVNSSKLDEDDIDAYIDWSQAFTYIVNQGVFYPSGNTVTCNWLTLTEGTGYYAWRVRRLMGPRGRSDQPTFLGPWTGTGPFTDGSTATASTAEDATYTCLFFYTQFNDDINWIFRRSIGDSRNYYFNVTELNEKIDFANDLLMPIQHQEQVHENLLKDKVHSIVTQTVPDYSGRPALQSLPTPISNNCLQYQGSILNNTLSQPYTAYDFDREANYNNPSDAYGNAAGYYSDGNADKRVPNAGGRPFGRTLYYNDGLNRPREISSPGSKHQPDPAHNPNNSTANTVRKFYSKPTTSELIRIMGDEAPKAESITKTYTRDPNGTWNITYTDEFNRTIITCQSEPGSALLANTSFFDPDRPVNSDTITQLIQVSPTSFVAKATYSFAVPTQLDYIYSITSHIYSDPCVHLCGSCDYRVTLTAKERDDTTTYRYVASVTPTFDSTTGTCTGMNVNTSGTYEVPNPVLSEGTYDVVATLDLQTADPATGKLYIDSATEMLHRRIDYLMSLGGNIISGGSGKTIAAMETYFTGGDIIGLMNYLGADTSKTTFKMVFSYLCDTIVLPTAHCRRPPCGSPQYAQYMKQMMYNDDNKNATSFFANAYGNTTTNGIAFTTDDDNLFLVASDAEFDGIITRMIADGYDCNALWDAWVMTVNSYIAGQKALAAKTGYSALGSLTPKFDWFEEFMGLVGHRFPLKARPHSGLYVSTDSIRLKPYRYFPYDWGSLTDVENAFCFMKNLANPCPSTGTPPGWADSIYNYPATDPSTQSFHMYNFYKNIKNPASGTLYNTLAALSKVFNPANKQKKQALANAKNACINACNNRLDVLMTDVATDFMDRWKMQVEGFVYDLSWRPAPVGTTVPLERVACLANSVVEYCKSKCDFVPDSGTGFTQARQDQIKKATAMPIEVFTRPDDSTATCPGDYDSVRITSMHARMALLNWLNVSISRLRDSLAASGVLTYKWAPFANGSSLLSAPLSTTPCSLDSLNISGDDLNGRFEYGSNLSATNAACSTSIKLYRVAYDSVFKSTETKVKLLVKFITAMSATDSVVVTETLPSGYTYVAGMGAESGGVMNYTLIGPRAANDTFEIEYTMKAPATTGTASFSGTADRYASGSIANSCSVNGQNIVAAECISLNYVRTEGNGDDSRFPLCHVCASDDSCGGRICARFGDLPTIIPDTTIRVKSCGEIVCSDFKIVLDAQLAKVHAKHEAKFRQNYADSCLNKRLIDQQWVNYYLEEQGMYTLYLYDRAGNLVRTVPPAGVVEDFSSPTRLDKPNNNFRNEYDYTTTGKVVRQKSNDGGETRYYYDRSGRLRLSQNAQQVIDNKYSYTKYDILDRVIETGIFTFTSAYPSTSQIENQDFPDNATYSARQYKTITVYSTPYTNTTWFTAGGGPLPGGAYQENIDNRVSYVITDEDGDIGKPGDQTVLIYSYDPHGNVTRLYEWVIGLDKPRMLEYHNGIVTGTVDQVELLDKDGGYDSTDNIKLRYCYNMEGRLSHVFHTYEGHWWSPVWDDGIAFPTSIPKYWTASYIYDQHNMHQVRRVQLGGYQQGIDYTYTVEGWLKAINHPDTSGNSDPGADIALSMSSALGPDGYETSLFRRDVFAEALFYYNGDFARPSSQFNNNTTTFLQDGTDLYNGNIRCWQTYIPTPYPGPTGNYYEQQNTGFKYVYDNNNRLTQTKFYYYNYGTGNWLSGGQYNETFSYSANGNIGAMGRFRATPSLTAQSTIEGGLSTQAGGFYNRPGHFANNLGTWDIPAGEAHTANFTYNANGELTAHDDDSNEYVQVSWTPYGKIHSMSNTDTFGNVETVTYLYDGMGNRMKETHSYSSGATAQHQYFVNSADGKLFATYAETGSSGMSVTERHLYGLEHLGIMRGANTYSTGLGAIDSMGDIDYEVHDHLGNVRVTFRDNNVIPHPYRPEMRSYYNYYAYGSLMPNRCWNALDYPSSFNGQRMDNIIGVGNLTTAKFWEYDTRLGIRWNRDPVPDFSLSPYLTFNGNPIWNTDYLGDKATFSSGRAEMQFHHTKKIIDDKANKYKSKIAKAEGSNQMDKADRLRLKGKVWLDMQADFNNIENENTAEIHYILTPNPEKSSSGGGTNYNFTENRMEVSFKDGNYMTIVHESSHASDWLNGAWTQYWDGDRQWISYDYMDEYSAYYKAYVFDPTTFFKAFPEGNIDALIRKGYGNKEGFIMDEKLIKAKKNLQVDQKDVDELLHRGYRVAQPKK